MINATVFNIMKYSIHDGPGIRTTVFLKGCPLSCRWCHNPEGINISPQTVFYPNKCIKCGNCTFVNGGKVCPTGAREVLGYDISAADLMSEIKKDLLFYEQSGGGVTFSGGEPLYQPDFLLSMLEKCEDEYIHTAVDTSGFCERNIIVKAAERAKLMLFDVKFFDEEKHIEYCGVSNKIILENLKALSETKVKINIRIPVIPSVNNDIREMRNICEYIKGYRNIVNVNLLPYHNLQSEKYKRLNMKYKMPEIPIGEICNIYDIKNIFESYNFKTKIGG